MDFREDQFVVEAFDCHPDGTLKPSVLMQYLQEAAARHAERLGVGFADLGRRGGFWVLANLRIEIARAAHWAETVTIRTWPSGCTRLSASREFLGQGPDGRELFRATSDWMILDQQSGRPKNLQRLDLHLPPDGPRVLNTDLARLRPADVYTPAGILSVPFSSLDFNGHVNNTEYVRWGLDGLHRMLGGCPAIRSLQTTYTAEVFAGDDIETLVAVQEHGPLYVLERKGGDPAGTNVFLMEVNA